MSRLNGTANVRLAGIRQHLTSGSRASSLGLAPSSRTTTTTAAADNNNNSSRTTQHDDHGRHSSTTRDPSSSKKKKKDTPSTVWTNPLNYRYWLSIQARWSDNDVYGHMNKFRAIPFPFLSLSSGLPSYRRKKKEKKRKELVDYRSQVRQRADEGQTWVTNGSAKYYELFDTIVNKYIQEEGKGGGEKMIGLVVHSSCDYLAPVAGFPGQVVLGLATAKVGETSVRWRVGVWSVDPRTTTTTTTTSSSSVDYKDHANSCHAYGLFIHTFVNPNSRHQPTPLSPALRNAALRLLVHNNS
ncbi:hypothetical protein VP01_666g15 [Puccinia sorghi]|uniref:Thioesterase domain-containing protein n=1 Tax=Puccinia sorghi TaxID=27349 RepID=A0A0L6UH28_9BASI|nr:hypothetical protein VP01_666g15 [Puccinia sorghi]